MQNCEIDRVQRAKYNKMRKYCSCSRCYLLTAIVILFEFYTIAVSHLAFNMRLRNDCSKFLRKAAVQLKLPSLAARYRTLLSAVLLRLIHSFYLQSTSPPTTKCYSRPTWVSASNNHRHTAGLFKCSVPINLSALAVRINKLLEHTWTPY